MRCSPRFKAVQPWTWFPEESERCAVRAEAVSCNRNSSESDPRSTLPTMSGKTNLSSAFIFDSENPYQRATLAHLYRNSSIIKVASYISAPPPGVRVYLRDLASAANSTANENACGSVLAGQTSEADEFGDICLWLGTGLYGEGHEADILRALNLSDSTRRARYRPPLCPAFLALISFGR